MNLSHSEPSRQRAAHLKGATFMVSLSKHVRTHFCGPSLRHVHSPPRASPERSRRYSGRWFNWRLQPSSPQLALSVIMVLFAFLLISTCWVLTGGRTTNTVNSKIRAVHKIIILLLFVAILWSGNVVCGAAASQQGGRGFSLLVLHVSA